jgi:hypothetical protein
MRKLLKKIAVSSAMMALTASGLVVATAQPAAACPSGPFYALTGSTVRIPFKNVPKFRNGPGGTITVSRHYSGTATFGPDHP